MIISLIGHLLGAGSMLLATNYSTDSSSMDSIPLETSTFIANVSIIIEDYYGKQSEWEQMAYSLIYLEKGTNFDRQRLSTSIKALEVCQRFKTIAVDTLFTHDSVSIVFTLSPFKTIRKVIISNEFPLFESEIVKATTLYTGKPFQEEAFPNQVLRIKALYKQEGFPQATVSIRHEINDKKGYVDLFIAIQPGPSIEIETISLTGNQSINSLRLKLRMLSWRRSIFPFKSLRRFIEKNNVKDYKSLLSFYKKRKKFADCLIEKSSDIDTVRNRANLSFVIKEGPRYFIDFVRINKQSEKDIRKSALKKCVTIYSRGNNHNLGVKKSIRNLKKYYASKGYPKASITVEDGQTSQQRANHKNLTFLIESGPRYVVSSISIKGNRVFTIKKIKKQMLTEKKGTFIEETFEKDLLAIQTLYRKNGYQKTTVTYALVNIDSSNISLALSIQEHVQTRISSIKGKGFTMLPFDKVRKKLLLKEGKPFQKSHLKSDVITLSARVAEKGFPYVQVNTDLSYNNDSSQVEVSYSVKKGKKVYLGNTFYSGNFRTKEQIMSREINTNKGEVFSLIKTLSGQRELRNFNIFNSISYKAIGLSEKNDTVNLFIAVEERKPFYFESGLGYEADRLWGECIIGDRNFLGLNKDVSLDIKANHIGGYRFDLRLVEPRLFASPTSAILNGYVERIIVPNKFGVDAYGASTGLTRKIGNHLALNCATAIEYRDQFTISNTSTDTTSEITDKELQPRKIIETPASISWDSRNSFVRPQRGFFSTADMKLSKGIENSLDDFIRYHFETRSYIRVLPKSILALVGRVGYIDPIGKNNSIPQDQLFFLGGTGDVRGYSETKLFSSGGRSTISASVEARIDLGFNFELALFYDTGWLGKNFTVVQANEFKSSIGTGLRFITPIGPIGLLYGFKINPNTDDDIGKAHFSLGYSF